MPLPYKITGKPFSYIGNQMIAPDPLRLCWISEDATGCLGIFPKRTALINRPFILSRKKKLGSGMKKPVIPGKFTKSSRTRTGMSHCKFSQAILHSEFWIFRRDRLCRRFAPFSAPTDGIGKPAGAFSIKRAMRPRYGATYDALGASGREVSGRYPLPR